MKMAANRSLLLAITLALLAGCASQPASSPIVTAKPTASADADLALLNRLSWGANGQSLNQLRAAGYAQYLAQQLAPDATVSLPPAVEAQIVALQISRKSLVQVVSDSEALRKAADAVISNDDDKKAAQQAYQQNLNQLAKEAALRSLLRDLYSPQQVREQMTWFWLNHFSVHQAKSNLRAMVGDYEDQLRQHALGRFRDLLAVTVRHPAMLRYLDNDQNALGHLNENYARELMELHTLGVDGGYTQRDVQELARILTGLGVNLSANKPNVKAALQNQYVREGLFEFNPNRHDYGDKILLGQTVAGSGLSEVDEALDRLARHPATAHFICRKLATYFVSDAPPEALVQRLAQTYLASDGRIADVLGALFRAPEFNASLGSKFKDPIHYVVSSVRLAYDDKTILNAGPMVNWLNRMGQPLYGHQTPDGYPLTQAAWASPGQMTTRFEIAKSIGTGSAGLFKTDGPQATERPAFPQLANVLFYQAMQASLSPTTRSTLDQAGNPQEWNTFLLASPEFMHR